MSKAQKLFSLFWRAEATAPSALRKVHVSLQNLNVLDEQPPVPGIILYPALLTPAIHVATTHDGMFEFLLLSRKSLPITPSDINLHLKIAEGLDPKKCASDEPLFANPLGKIFVKQVEPDGNHILATKHVFKGQIDPRIRRRLKKDGLTSSLDAYYAVRVHESCLSDEAVVKGPNRKPTVELQDLLIQNTLKAMNGPALRGTDGRGTHCFSMKHGKTDLRHVDHEHPICSYHPLFFYPKDALAQANFGHVSDIHLNARQELMSMTPARVIDDERAMEDSPPIGGMMNVHLHSFHEILNSMGSNSRMDVLLAGGDYIDHIDNVYPHYGDRANWGFEKLTAANVWSLMDLRDERGYSKNYQAFVDFICFYGEMRWFCSTFAKPIYGISGNHDCYEGAFGVSPRLLGNRANEGIPADLNLTFYEAMLAFGETWDVLRSGPKSPFNARSFEWYYMVLTPFSDFVVELPQQRLAALAWGEDEEVVSIPGSDSMGQGKSHLPRAEEAVTNEQLALFMDGLRPDKKTVLMTHFTFVSFNEVISENDHRTDHGINTANPGESGLDWPFSFGDMGTFEKNRRRLYGEVADSKKVQFVVTGHSHRKGLYLLGAKKGDHFETEMHGLSHPLNVQTLPGLNGRTPIIVSDSAGPLPRKNLSNEFMEWGSDRPAGSLITVSPNGAVERVEAIATHRHQTLPRLAVALEFLHVSKDHVFEKIVSKEFETTNPWKDDHGLTITFRPVFPSERFTLESITLYCRVSELAPWQQVKLKNVAVVRKKKKKDKEGEAYGEKVSLFVEDDQEQKRAFLEWLTMSPKSGRFMSIKFRVSDSGISPGYQQTDAWNIEVDAAPDFSSGVSKSAENKWIRMTHYLISPYGGTRGTGNEDLRKVTEAPSFHWRRRSAIYQ